MIDLANFGWSPFFAEQWNGELIPARIAAEHRGAYEVWSTHGDGFARLSGALRHSLGDDLLPGVGDWVALRDPPSPDGATHIERLFNRRTLFVRGAAGREARRQVIAANVDVVFVVCGLDRDFNVRRIERYLAAVWTSGAQPVVVLSKSDVCADPQALRAEVEERCAGAEVHVVCAVRGDGLDAIRASIGAGQTAALVGSSGAGKSTIVNALLGQEFMATREVSATDGRGQHTTTHRQLVRMPGGGLLLDTPGMRELQLASEAGIDAAFDDVEALAQQCRFGDCTHGAEPGCAVRAAVTAGELEASRLENYEKLQREARSYELRQDEHARRQQERVFCKMVREVVRDRQRKRGG